MVIIEQKLSAAFPDTPVNQLWSIKIPSIFLRKNRPNWQRSTICYYSATWLYGFHGVQLPDTDEVNQIKAANVKRNRKYVCRQVRGMRHKNTNTFKKVTVESGIFCLLAKLDAVADARSEKPNKLTVLHFQWVKDQHYCSFRRIVEPTVLSILPHRSSRCLSLSLSVAQRNSNKSFGRKNSVHSIYTSARYVRTQLSNPFREIQLT